MKNLIKLCLTIIALLGCSSSIKFPINNLVLCQMPETWTRKVYIDKSFTPQQILMIRKAIYLWWRTTSGRFNYIIDGYFEHKELKDQPNIISNDKVYIFNSFGHEKYSVDYYKKNSSVKGIAGKSAIVMLSTDDPTLTNETFIGILAHEIGHTAGLPHIENDPDSLMAPICSVACYDNRITLNDLWLLCSKGNKVDNDKIYECR